MRSWAAQRQRRVLFLDFDALSLAPNPPPTTRDWDKHYMCGFLELRSLPVETVLNNVN